MIRPCRLDPACEGALQNRLFLRRDFLGEGSAARPLLEELLRLPEPEWPDTLHLHEALFRAYESNWGLASAAVGKALALRVEGFAVTNTDDWMRASAVLIHLNYGAGLLAFLDERGDTARFRHWVEGLRAILIGDKRALQNIAPEIRTTAEFFHNGISRRLLKLPAKTGRRPLPADKPKRARGN